MRLCRHTVIWSRRGGIISTDPGGSSSVARSAKVDAIRASGRKSVKYAGLALWGGALCQQFFSVPDGYCCDVASAQHSRYLLDAGSF